VPGVGKTTLLAALCPLPPALTVRIACPDRAHTAPYSGVRNLLSFIDQPFEVLAARFAALLEGCMTATLEMAVDPIAMGSALVALLGVVAERAPLLVVIDDAQWIDPSSGIALSFAARRLADEPVAFVLAAREGEPVPGEGGGEALHLHGLAPIDAALLLGPEVEPAVAEELVVRTDGNPLALLEISTALTPEQMKGDTPLDPELAVPDAISCAFLRRVRDLSPGANRLLLFAAAEPTLDAEQGALLARSLGPADANALSELTWSGLLRMERDRLQPAHPLLAAAVYQSADPGTRRDAHRRLSALLEPVDPDRAAWHLASATAEHDEVAASRLDLAATRAAAAGDALAAARALERAAELSVHPGDAAARFASAGAAYHQGGDSEQAVRAWDDALALTDDAASRADIQLARILPAAMSGRTDVVPDDLVALADALGGRDPGRAGRLHLSAAVLGALLGCTSAESRRRMDRALTRLQPDDPLYPLAEGFAAFFRLQSGDARCALPELRRVAETLRTRGVAPQMSGVIEATSNGLTWCDDFSAASLLVTAMIESARLHSNVQFLLYGLTARWELYFRTGQWRAAHADATEAVELAFDSGLVALAGGAQACRTRSDAALGLDTDAIARAEEALALLSAGGTEATPHGWWLRGALGFAHLSAGRFDRAVPHLDWADNYALEREMLLLNTVPAAPDLVEAYVHTQRAADARRIVDRLDRTAAEEQGHSAAALVARCRGLVAEDYEEHFASAIGHHEQVPTPFERARTELCWGERLQGQGRKRAARGHLECAAATFERLGARPWLRRADPGSRRLGTVAADELSPREYQIALVVGRGATNQEAAAELFLSRRTVESHLVSIYRKLGIRSRSELARRVAAIERDPGSVTAPTGSAQRSHP
jgi:DNA-binding CsgD family transcriptional regulator